MERSRWEAVSTRRRLSGVRAAQAGVTLIEVLVAGLVASLGIIGIAMMFGEAQTYLAAEVDDRIGVGLAQQKIEALRGLGFDCIPVGGGASAGLHAVLPLGASTSTAPPTDAGGACRGATPCCPDTSETRAARTYSEDQVDHQAPGDPEKPLFDPSHASYATRVTTVECVDPSTFTAFAPQACGNPPLAKRITVDVTPRSNAARAIRAEALLTYH